jgi:hypothetical protein
VKTRRVQQQGSTDGLCGIYSLLNFFQKQKYFDDPDFTDGPSVTAFWYLVEAMGAEGLLSPYYLVYGLESQQIRAIANKICTDHGLAFQAVALKSVLEHLGLKHFIDLAPTLFEKRNTAAVVGEDGKSHWVLIDDWKGGYLQVRDSSNVERLQVGRSAALNITHDGVVILPKHLVSEFTGGA